jgi:hypothetical protein
LLRFANKKELADGTQNTAEFQLFQARGSADRLVGSRNDSGYARNYSGFARSLSTTVGFRQHAVRVAAWRSPLPGGFHDALQTARLAGNRLRGAA